MSKEIDFGAPAPFDDTNAVNVINGIVKCRRYPRRKHEETSAAQNYGFALGIMRRPSRLLDLSQCRYTGDLAAGST